MIHKIFVQFARYARQGSFTERVVLIFRAKDSVANVRVGVSVNQALQRQFTWLHVFGYRTPWSYGYRLKWDASV